MKHQPSRLNRPGLRAAASAAKATFGLALLLCSSAGPQAAGTFRWVDENGAVHYTDQVPPDESKRAHTKLNEKATKVLEVVEQQKTPEQLEQARRLKRLRIDQQRILTEQRDSDTSLSRTYHSEAEMQAALQGRLNSIDSAKKIADSNRLHQEEVLKSLIKRAADTENAGQPVSKLLRDNIESTRKQIASYQEKSRALENSKGGVVAAFDKDLQRLKSLQEMGSNPDSDTLKWKAQRSEADVLVVSAITCEPAQCDRAWALAKEYLKIKTPRPLVTETPTIMQTAGPRKEQDMALLVVRISGKTSDTLFLDTSCHISSLGDDLCTSETARDIRAGFAPFIEERLKAEAR